MAIETDPITAWFIPRVTPPGGAPHEVRVDCVDVPLPLRYDLPTDAADSELLCDKGWPAVITFTDSELVLSSDAIKSLRIFGRNQAADWWEQYSNGALYALEFFVEGKDQILADSILRLMMPGIEAFDEVQV